MNNSKPAGKNGFKMMRRVKRPQGYNRDLIKNLILYGAVFLILISIIFTFAAPPNPTPSEPLSQVFSQAQKGEVKKISVNGNNLEVTLNSGQTYTSRKEDGSSLVDELQKAGISPAGLNIEIKDDTTSSRWFDILGSLLPIVLMIGFFLLLMRQARGASDSIFSFGKSRAKLFSKDKPEVTFANVAGVDEAKRELSEVVEFLKEPEKFRRLGARTPKGVLLLGPAGVGKTLLARALAGEAGVPFFSMAGSEFMEMLVGVGASRVRDLFETAKKNAPAIIFIDEIESIGRQRGMGMMGGHDEREQTLNQILVEMDGFEPNTSVVVIAATNRPNLLDPALVRPGRFDRQIRIDLPDIEGRKDILKIHMKGKPVNSVVDLNKLAKRTVGFSGADLENMLNEAAILAARAGKKEIDAGDLEEAATKVKLGPEKRRLQSDEDKKMTAYHEAGHALVSSLLPHMDPVHRISIVSRGLALGFTMIPPSQDRYNETKTRFLEQIAVMLGGRAAEEIVFNEMTAGAGSDIENASRVARAMVMEYGMSELGPISFNFDDDTRYLLAMGGEGQGYSEEMAKRIDLEVKKILDEAFVTAKKLLAENRDKLDAIVKALLEKETLEADEFERLINKEPLSVPGLV
ncbi:MAG: ATP-dependent zinc metalloprotease FtsH [Patescibacteria group bacterium]|nr:ATP-dependent zinc metalloprotease FtsH [Patescibacteria group bacterium]